MAEVFVLLNLHGSVAEAFLIVVFLDDLLRAVDDVGRDVVALHELEALVEVFYLPFSGAMVVYLADARLLAQMNRQPCLVAGSLVDGYRHFREEGLAPEAACGSVDLGAGDCDAFADFQGRVAQNEIVVVVRSTFDIDSGDLVGTRQPAEIHYGVCQSVGGGLGRRAGRGYGEE